MKQSIGLLNEKKETLSNLAFPIVGLIVYLIDRSQESFLLIMTVMGMTSYFYHERKEKSMQTRYIDWIGMIFTFGFMGAVLLAHPLGWLGAALFTVLYFMFLVGKKSVAVEVAYVGVPLTIILLLTKSLLSVGIILAVFGLAYWIRAKDDNPEQDLIHDSTKHAVWHVLMAIDCGLMIWLP